MNNKCSYADKSNFSSEEAMSFSGEKVKFENPFKGYPLADDIFSRYREGIPGFYTWMMAFVGEEGIRGELARAMEQDLYQFPRSENREVLIAYVRESDMYTSEAQALDDCPNEYKKEIKMNTNKLRKGKNGGYTEIVNNRPCTYSTDFECEDDELVDSLNEYDRKLVFRWISEMLRPADSVCDTCSSYVLKHFLEMDTGVYITNNLFKDAMMIAGYRCKNEKDYNYKYYIDSNSLAFARELRRKFMLPIFAKVWDKPEWKEIKDRNKNGIKGFYNYMMQFRDDDSPEGEFARDLKKDLYNFPKSNSGVVIMNYLELCCGACDAALEVFKRCWKKYRESLKNEVVEG